MQNRHIAHRSADTWLCSRHFVHLQARATPGFRFQVSRFRSDEANSFANTCLPGNRAIMLNQSRQIGIGIGHSCHCKRSAPRRSSAGIAASIAAAKGKVRFRSSTELVAEIVCVGRDKSRRAGPGSMWAKKVCSFLFMNETAEQRDQKKKKKRIQNPSISMLDSGQMKVIIEKTDPVLKMKSLPCREAGR